MDDNEFLKQVEAGQIHAFPHEAHLRMAWLYLHADGFERGSEQICAAIRKVAAAHGAPGKYHETITRFWIYLVHHALTLTPEIESFEAFLAAHDHLPDGGLLKRHYSADLLRESRAVWTAPDLIPLPGAAMEAEPEA